MRRGEKYAYLKGAPRPQGYMAWYSWAESQWKQGLRQMRCSVCGRWNFPQEFPCTHKVPK